MDCNTLIEYLSDYIDNNLDEDLTAEAQQHLATCQNCRVVLNTTQRTILLYQEQGKLVIPPRRRQKLYSQIEAAFRKKNQ